MLERGHQLVIFAALLLDAEGKLALDRFHRPATEVVIQVSRRKIQFCLRELALHADHAIANQSAARYDHGEYLGVSKSLEMYMLEGVLRPGRGDSNSDAVGD